MKLLKIIEGVIKLDRVIKSEISESLSVESFFSKLEKTQLGWFWKYSKKETETAWWEKFVCIVFQDAFAPEPNKKPRRRKVGNRSGKAEETDDWWY